MINTLTCYTISCDVCGHTLDEWYWKTPSEAEEYANEQEEWLITTDGLAICLSSNEKHRDAALTYLDRFHPCKRDDIIDYYKLDNPS